MPPLERPPVSVIIRTRARVCLRMREGRWSARPPRLGRPDNEQRSSTCTEGGASEIETAQLKQSFSSDRRHGKGSCSVVSDSATPWIVAYQAPPSMGFSRQEYWSGLPFPSPGESSQPRDQTWVSHIGGKRFNL